MNICRVINEDEFRSRSGQLVQNDDHMRHAHSLTSHHIAPGDDDDDDDGDDDAARRCSASASVVIVESQQTAQTPHAATGWCRRC